MLLLPFEPGLFEDTIERPDWHVQTALSCNCDRAGLNRMLKLAVTAFGANVAPPILFEEANYLANVHVNVLLGTAHNDEVERRTLTETRGTLSQSFDILPDSPQLRPVAPTDC